MILRGSEQPAIARAKHLIDSLLALQSGINVLNTAAVIVDSGGQSACLEGLRMGRRGVLWLLWLTVVDNGGDAEYAQPFGKRMGQNLTEHVLAGA